MRVNTVLALAKSSQMSVEKLRIKLQLWIRVLLIVVIEARGCPPV